jgi:PAS domain S-box-containing protein
LIVTALTASAGGLWPTAALGYVPIAASAIWSAGLRGGTIAGAATALAWLVIALLGALGQRFPEVRLLDPPAGWIYAGCAAAAAILPTILAVRRRDSALAETARSEAFSDAIIEHIPGIFALLAEDGRILRLNSRLASVTGLETAALLNRQAATIFAAQDGPAAREVLDRCLSEGFAVQELSLCHRDGLHAPHLCYATRVVTDGARRAAVIGIDLLERRRAEAALRRFEQRYRDFLERVGLAAITVDLEVKLQFVNESFEALSGYTRAEVLGRPLLAYMEPEDVPKAIDRLNLVVTGRENIALLESRLIAKDGRHLVLQWNLTPIFHPDGAIGGATLLGVDLTARQYLEAQLQQSQKLESLGRLAAGVAHDFNNILMIIGGFAEVLRTATAGGEREQAISEILSACERAATLTRQLLAFSRRQILAPQAVDLNELILESRQMLARLLGAGIRIEAHLAPDPVKVLADPGQLHQVVMNLAVNARDAMPAGGVLTLSSAAAGDTCQLIVADTGHGMSEQIRKRAFEPFFTTKEPGEGSGLGLAMVYGIVEQSKGEIRLESTLGKGTVVTISLPAAEDLAPSPLPTREVLTRKPLRILLVEDEPGVRDLVGLLLKDYGHCVIAAEDGPSALEVAEDAGFDFDAAVVDVVMPYMSGPEMVVRLRERRPDLPVVFISGYSHTPPVDIQGTEGRTGFLQKPFKPEDLFGAIERVRTA